MMSESLPNSAAQNLTGDRALSADDVDRLGFADIAKRLATTLVSHATDAGMVVGINGGWGSGKSSLVNLTERELQRLPREMRPSIVHFKPWLVGKRDVLLASFMSDLASAIARVEHARGDATAVSAEKAKKAAEAARAYTKYLARTGDMFELAGEWWGPLKWIGKALKALGSWWGNEKAPASLPKAKEQLTTSLRELGHRFLVVIDDVDRLEPSEIMEVLRLVRSVADFPNVIYLLCYDGDVLADSIEDAGNISDGHAFMEKIIQLTLMVPTPEAFQLRQWFFSELSKFALLIAAEK